MKWHSYRSVGLAALLASAPLAAQDAPRRITFDEAVGIALHDNASVIRAANAAVLSEATVKQQRQSFLPSLSVSVSGANTMGRTFDQADGRVIDRNTQSMNAGVSSSVTLFDGFRNVSNLRAAQLSEDASGEALARAKQTAAFTVASNFLSLIAQQEQLKVQEQTLAAQEAQEAQIDRFVQAGTRPISDLYQQQATVAATRASVVETKRAVEVAKTDLMQTLQLDAAQEYEFVSPAVGEASLDRRYSLDSLMTAALRHRSDLEAEKARVDAAAQDVRAAAAGKLPSVSLSAGYSTGLNSANELPVRDQLDQRRGGSVSLGVSIPLYDRGTTALAEQRAQIEADNARLALDEQRQSVALEVRRAYLDHETAKERLRAAQAQNQAAEQALTAVRERYRVGAATLVEVTTAQSSQAQAAAALVNARYTLVFQQALMSYYTGELDPERMTLG